MSTRKKTVIPLILCILWTILIFVLCTLPQHKLPKINIPHIDKAAHFVFFFVQSVLLCLLFRIKRKKIFFFILSATFLAFIYGGTIELLQQNYFHRTGDWYDLLADVLGGFIGALLCPLFLKTNI